MQSASEGAGGKQHERTERAVAAAKRIVANTEYRSTEEQRRVFLEGIYADYVELHYQAAELHERKGKIDYDIFQSNRKEINELLFGKIESHELELGDWNTWEKVETIVKKYAYGRPQQRTEKRDELNAITERAVALSQTVIAQRKRVHELKESIAAIQGELNGLLNLVRMKDHEIRSLTNKNNTYVLQIRHLDRECEALRGKKETEDDQLFTDLRLIIEANKALERENAELRGKLHVKYGVLDPQRRAVQDEVDPFPVFPNADDVDRWTALQDNMKDNAKRSDYIVQQIPLSAMIIQMKKNNKIWLSRLQNEVNNAMEKLDSDANQTYLLGGDALDTFDYPMLAFDAGVFTDYNGYEAQDNVRLPLDPVPVSLAPDMQSNEEDERQQRHPSGELEMPSGDKRTSNSSSQQQQQRPSAAETKVGVQKVSGTLQSSDSNNNDNSADTQTLHGKEQVMTEDGYDPERENRDDGEVPFPSDAGGGPSQPVGAASRKRAGGGAQKGARRSKNSIDRSRNDSTTDNTSGRRKDRDSIFIQRRSTTSGNEGSPVGTNVNTANRAAWLNLRNSILGVAELSRAECLRRECLHVNQLRQKMTKLHRRLGVLTTVIKNNASILELENLPPEQQHIVTQTLHQYSSVSTAELVAKKEMDSPHEGGNPSTSYEGEESAEGLAASGAKGHGAGGDGSASASASASAAHLDATSSILGDKSRSTSLAAKRRKKKKNRDGTFHEDDDDDDSDESEGSSAEDDDDDSNGSRAGDGTSSRKKKKKRGASHSGEDGTCTCGRDGVHGDLEHTAQGGRCPVHHGDKRHGSGSRSSEWGSAANPDGTMAPHHHGGASAAGNASSFSDVDGCSVRASAAREIGALRREKDDLAQMVLQLRAEVLEFTSFMQTLFGAAFVQLSAESLDFNNSSADGPSFTGSVSEAAEGLAFLENERDRIAQLTTQRVNAATTERVLATLHEKYGIDLREQQSETSDMSDADWMAQKLRSAVLDMAKENIATEMGTCSELLSKSFDFAGKMANANANANEDGVLQSELANAKGKDKNSISNSNHNNNNYHVNIKGGNPRAAASLSAQPVNFLDIPRVGGAPGGRAGGVGRNDLRLQRGSAHTAGDSAEDYALWNEMMNSPFLNELLGAGGLGTNPGANPFGGDGQGANHDGVGHRAGARDGAYDSRFGRFAGRASSESRQAGGGPHGDYPHSATSAGDGRNGPWGRNNAGGPYGSEFGDGISSMGGNNPGNAENRLDSNFVLFGRPMNFPGNKRQPTKWYYINRGNQFEPYSDEVRGDQYFQSQQHPPVRNPILRRDGQHILEMLRCLQQNQSVRGIQAIRPIVYRYDFETEMEAMQAQADDFFAATVKHLFGEKFDSFVRRSILPIASLARNMASSRQPLSEPLLHAVHQLREKEARRKKERTHLLFRRIATGIRSRRFIRNQQFHGNAFVAYISVLYDRWRRNLNNKRKGSLTDHSEVLRLFELVNNQQEERPISGNHLPPLNAPFKPLSTPRAMVNNTGKSSYHFEKVALPNDIYKKRK